MVTIMYIYIHTRHLSTVNWIIKKTEQEIKQNF